MDWGQFALLMLSMGGLFFWNRSETNSDRRQMQQDAANDRREILQLIHAIKDEMKDFHGRLEKIDTEFKHFLMNQPKSKSKEK